ncbi:Cyclin-B2-1 [Capsicum baccatum]|uniref:Cyclin-B2-1 n=1 Tax=Capsicum baccatum TaxID=33114 RepID=A0A2G2W5N1_CAPBA|nr:Cyclin-B2-1 [Capsicum baccatum]
MTTLSSKMQHLAHRNALEVHYKFELMEEILYLTMNLIDRFLAVHGGSNFDLTQGLCQKEVLEMCTLGVSKEWNATCEKHSSYDKNQILECSKLMVSFHQKAAVGKLNRVHRKYSTSKYGNAARCEPAFFLLEAWF